MDKAKKGKEHDDIFDMLKVCFYDKLIFQLNENMLDLIWATMTCIKIYCANFSLVCQRDQWTIDSDIQSNSFLLLLKLMVKS